MSKSVSFEPSEAQRHTGHTSLPFVAHVWLMQSSQNLGKNLKNSTININFDIRLGIFLTVSRVDTIKIAKEEVLRKSPNILSITSSVTLVQIN